jgi:hypothetical protein
MIVVDLTYRIYTHYIHPRMANPNAGTGTASHVSGSDARPSSALRPYTTYRIPETTDGREDMTHATLGGTRRVPGPPSCAALYRYIIQEAGLSVMTEP